MSVRAYRVNKIESEDNPSFNLWHNTELMEYLNKNGYHDNNTMIDVDVEVLEGALDIPELEQSVKDALKKDIEWAKENGDTEISYMCF